MDDQEFAESNLRKNVWKYKITKKSIAIIQKSPCRETGQASYQIAIVIHKNIILVTYLQLNFQIENWRKNILINHIMSCYWKLKKVYCNGKDLNNLREEGDSIELIRNALVP